MLLLNRLVVVAKNRVGPSVSVVLRPIIRHYAKSWDNNTPANDKLEAHLKVQELMNQIQSNPQVVAKLDKIRDIMLQKGLANGNGQQSMGAMQVIKILMDKNIREAMTEFKQELEKANIKLGPEQLGPLMTVLGIEKKK